MGILSTFGVAVPSVVIERIMSAEKGFLNILWLSGSNYLLLASGFMILAASSFYKQRSLLAWFYGQIALTLALSKPNTARWLIDADSWASWIPYNVGVGSLYLALFEYTFAVVSTFQSIGGAKCSRISTWLCCIASVFWMVHLIVLCRFRYNETPWRAFIRLLLSK